MKMNTIQGLESRLGPVGQSKIAHSGSSRRVGQDGGYRVTWELSKDRSCSDTVLLVGPDCHNLPLTVICSFSPNRLTVTCSREV